MDNHNREAGFILMQQLREVYAEIERAKSIHVELLKAILPRKLWLVGLETAELGTVRTSKHVSN